MPRLAEIAERVPGARLRGAGDPEVCGVTHDSRAVRPGYLFAALPGARTDGRRFVDDALARGAVAVLSGEPIERDVPQLLVDDPRLALGPAAAAGFGNPTAELALVGITGTNGKTTITYLVEGALLACGARPGVMGTVEYRFAERRWGAQHTTPEAPVIQAVAREMVQLGASHLLMEVSSHALALERHRGCEFDVVAFTNLTQDHLDFHRDMAEYGAAKLRLFTAAIADRPAARAVVNVDDRFGREIVGRLRHPVLTVSCDPAAAAAVRPSRKPQLGTEGIVADIVVPDGDLRLVSPLLGAHNLNNLLVALGISLQLGLDAHRVVQGLSRVRAVPGRLERVPSVLDFTVLVDYAHTPDALVSVLASLRGITPGRLICVFGCGGDRDQAKRPLMGRAVAEGADVAVVTSDNPRTEDPRAIVEMILPGVAGQLPGPLERAELPRAASGYAVEVDRARAIRRAIESAAPGDTVLIAGKGHEDYQILGTEKVHFDDREQAAAALAARGGGGDG